MPYFYLFKVGDERVKVGFGADRSFTHKATCQLGLQVLSMRQNLLDFHNPMCYDTYVVYAGVV